METSGGDEARRDYIPLILQIMADRETAQRSLALKTGISKSRLALLLHRNPAKRCRMSVEEFDKILHALGTTIVRALMRDEIFRDVEPMDRDRYEGVVEFVCEFMVGLGQNIIEALETIGGIDGSEVRKEWAATLKKGVTKQVALAVADLMRRRTLIAERDDLWR